jgi:hypothetical protein
MNNTSPSGKWRRYHVPLPVVALVLTLFIGFVALALMDTMYEWKSDQQGLRDSAQTDQANIDRIQGWLK